ncbi:4'-phosphopantetheinyl transferase family protein [Pedobacter sp. SL55]|uniref:4'-phosphopantetheinyl transferase family protein n=1 Tax=Pedobacter sp. SL55 TaxID=2995161 RepID=UPI0022701F91|nr:4'-phosphopantetheinyl transferase superfamily protein [Pedobacter sp. SL55]WAC41141.1 4'-phosphopantetheinyl transferase superfamily protein [Pedobacter sp. SL55]
MIDTLLSYNFAWKPYSVEQPLATDKTHIFRISVDNYFPKIKRQLAEVLSDREQEKAGRMFIQKDKERYVVSKFCLRTILSFCLKTAPHEIDFIFHDHKKPTVNGIEFNISHTGDYVLIAISPKPVGIDVEYLNREFDFKSILDITFSKNEIEFIGNKDIDPTNFYVMWTRKEALLKASGEGVSDNLHLIECLEEHLEREKEVFKMRTFMIEENYVASIATTLDQKELMFWNWV